MHFEILNKILTEFYLLTEKMLEMRNSVNSLKISRKALPKRNSPCLKHRGRDGRPHKRIGSLSKGQQEIKKNN